MPNATFNGNNIAVHSRGSLRLEYKAYLSDGTTQVDASGWNLWFEVDGVSIRQKLIADPNDAMGQLAVLDTTVVVQLDTENCPYIIRDESVSNQPVVVQEGYIKRYGYDGAPDNVVG